MGAGGAFARGSPPLGAERGGARGGVWGGGLTGAKPAGAPIKEIIAQERVLLDAGF